MSRTKLEQLHDELSEAVEGGKPTHNAAAALVVELMACGAVRTVMPDKPPVFLICKECGGMNIRADANAVWDVERQRYELDGVYDNTDCLDCDGECSVGEKPVEGASFDVQRRPRPDSGWPWDAVENFATLHEAEAAIADFEKAEAEWEYRAVPVWDEKGGAA